MTDIEEAISYIESTEKHLRHLGESWYADYLSDALALLKEQEAAEPEPAEHIVFGTNRKCSVCGKHLFPAGKFCPHCGQAVNWGD